MEHLLAPEDVAEILGVPKKTLYRWRQHGYGPASFIVGRHIRYRPADVEAFIEAQFAEEDAADVLA